MRRLTQFSPYEVNHGLSPAGTDELTSSPLPSSVSRVLFLGVFPEATSPLMLTRQGQRLSWSLETQADIRHVGVDSAQRQESVELFAPSRWSVLESDLDFVGLGVVRKAWQLLSSHISSKRLVAS